jgi:hypothetical protein
MAVDNEHGAAPLSWFVTPGETDVLAWIALGFLFLAIYGVIVLYASFDRWAEHKSHGTPLAKTIPTMLTVALLYEIFPLGHFNILLPISAILIALLADWSRFHSIGDVETGTDQGSVAPAPSDQISSANQPEDAKNA